MRAFDVDLGSVARLMRRREMAGAFAVAGVAVAGWAAAGWIPRDVSSRRPPSADRAAMETAAGIGRVAVEAAVGETDNHFAVVEAWYSLSRIQTPLGRDPFGEQAGQSGGREAVANPEPDIQAVWLQDGVRMAIIDGVLVREGGMHRGHRVEHCEDGAVWLTAGGVCRRWEIRFPAVSADRLGVGVP